MARLEFEIRAGERVQGLVGTGAIELLGWLLKVFN